MFEQTFVETNGRTRRSRAVVASFLLQLAALAVLVIVPLWFTEAIGVTRGIRVIAPPPAAPKPPAAGATRSATVPTRLAAPNPFVAPPRVPEGKPIMIADAEIPALGGGVADGVPGPTGVIIGVPSFGASAFPMAPPPAPRKVETPPRPTRVNVGGQVQAANLVRKVMPNYPPLAKQARISGTVRFTAIIARDGTIQNLQFISGHPLLVEAAREAVKLWVYKPTLLNGEPVEVVTQIDVNFTLSGN